MSQERPPIVLIGDETHENIAVLAELLQSAGFSSLGGTSQSRIVALAKRYQPDVVLLDTVLEDVSGFTVCRALKESEDTEDIPIIFLSNKADLPLKVEGFESGAADFMTRPFQSAELISRIQNQVQLRSLIQEREVHISDLHELLDQKDKVMQVVSHDLRSPLGGIKGLAEMLETGSESEDPETVRDFAQSIRQTSESLLGLVNDLLDIAKLESGKLALTISEFEIRELVMQCIETMQLLAYKKSVNLQMHLGHENDEVWVQADRPKLMQVFNNILSNAVKFTPSSGTVSVTVNTGDFVEITFTDTGVGIPAEILPNLFEKFGSHQREGTDGEKGTGLGMPIVKKFVEVHGGTVEVSSIVGEGTTFVVTLPLKSTVKNESVSL